MRRIFLLLAFVIAACSSSSDPAPRHCSADADCDDGVYCNGAETCDVAADRCVRGAAPACDDGVACTIDLCDEARHGCAHVPDANACGAGEACSATVGCGPAPECDADADCDDGFFCNGKETCGADHRCVAGTPPSCDDGVSCTVDFCDELQGRCVAVADAWACPEGDRCTPAGCAPVPECQVDADCDDRLFCNGPETCDTAAGRCVAGVRPDCDDAVACTVDVCDEALARCQHVADATRCAGGEVCSPTAGCEVPPACAVDADCDDGLFCDGVETCDPVQHRCLAGTPPACDDGVACTLDVCDESVRACLHLDEPAAAGCARLAVAPTGAGSVTSSPAGIDCGTACEAWFAPGSVVTLTAAPGAAAAFAGWSGGCMGAAASCDVTMSGPRQVGAAFVPATYLLSVTETGTGSGSVVSFPAGIGCGADCSEAYPSGTLVFLTATPTAGSTFAGWSGACAGTDTCIVSMDAAQGVSARFDKAMFVLSVSKAGTGGGTVTSSPSSISCGSTCSATLQAGTFVTLTAVADANSTFAGWSGACNGTGACGLTLDGAKAVTATFTRVSYALTVTRTGGGTVVSSPAGIYCGASCSAQLDAGSVVTLTAAPDLGATFAGWTGACTGTSGTCDVPMSSAKSVSARFTYPVTVASAGTGGGVVTSAPAGISCGSTCSSQYDGGSTVTLTAAPDATSTFAGWAGACAGTGTCTLALDAAKSAIATFTRNPWGLTIVRTGGGTVTSAPGGLYCGTACSASFAAGSAVTLTATPDEFWSFAGWGGACASAGTGTCSLTMNAATTVSATFVLNTFSLTVTRAGPGIGTVSSSPAGIACGATCSALFDGGTYVELSPAPAVGSSFAGWSGACSGTGACLVRMDQARTVTATFSSP